jgi:hypothetical protein
VARRERRHQADERLESGSLFLDRPRDRQGVLRSDLVKARCQRDKQLCTGTLVRILSRKRNEL